jgi:PleD family two-component response regulator
MYIMLHIMKKHRQQPVVSETAGQYISTLDAAKLCGVSTFSIQRWFDEGLLIGARLPGGKRKISADSLKRFMAGHGLLPAEGAKVDALRVLVVDRDARTLDAVKDYLAANGKVLVRTASNGLDAGLAAAEFGPDVVLVSTGIEDIPAVSLIQRIRRSAVTRNARLVALSGKGPVAEALEIRKAGADVCLSRPLDMKELGKALKL